MNTSAPTIDPQVYARRWKTLAVLSLSLVIIGLDNTILNVALPSLQTHFNASTSTLQWIVDSYLLVFAGLLLTMGTLGDRFGRKRALQAGLLLFGGASLAVLLGHRQPADRAARRDGHRRRDDHAGDAVDHLQRLPARGARQGDRHLGGHGGRRHRSRPAVRRPPARVLRLDLGVHGQRAGRGPRLVAGIWLVPESRDPRAGRFDLLGAGLSIGALVTLVYGIIEAPSEAGRTRWSWAASRPRRCSAAFVAGSCAPPTRC